MANIGERQILIKVSAYPYLTFFYSSVIIIDGGVIWLLIVVVKKIGNVIKKAFLIAFYSEMKMGFFLFNQPSGKMPLR